MHHSVILRSKHFYNTVFYFLLFNLQTFDNMITLIICLKVQWSLIVKHERVTQQRQPSAADKNRTRAGQEPDKSGREPGKSWTRAR